MTNAMKDLYILSVEMIMSGFTEVWGVDYPLNDDVITYITHVGQDTREISEDELNEMLSRQILEPTDIT